MPRHTVQVRVAHGHALLAAGIRAALAPHVPVAVAAGGTPGIDQPPPLDDQLDDRRVLIIDLTQALALHSDDLEAGTAGHKGPVLVVESGLTARKVRALLRTGASCVSADACPHELVRAVHALAAGEAYFCPVASGLLADAIAHPDLTPREQHVLELLSDGLDNKSIARRMDIALGTVKCHVKAILAKTGARTRTGVAAQAIRQGWIDARPPAHR
ncbi:LuxR C-terminal-related transcriptional regulator [Roseateles sp. DC23W]|uniref:LuxR C-terminal-related transcriptional regulator n=1 Tax=Pelomonas dachongensis TaxID=3299029 RepID=A0ABW7ENN6_9BURK